ncbi:GIY-YIG nuclease family protein [Leifsonia sp. ZF2019]|uniref:GIY-YIG nuclease family protein n=1 Tax=Leifsonia sp. ZF2019 TaxID=2781978 RepID=UPI001CBAC7ED|nr:GIY-YIG nuclease family protein [Leifsonia sp. ZF2019]UAJ79965.1 GIY-YIG nuclease family protein [Leifsonia sp. ZF2019]
MTSRRSNRVKVPKPYCKICMNEIHHLDKPLIVRDYFICITCALQIHAELRYKYVMPEVTAMERFLHQKKHGDTGWREEPTPKREPGWVYYIRMGDLIKIGYATDVAKRMRNYPPSAQLLAAHPGTIELEREMHKRFSPDLARGREWFTESSDLSAHIAQVVAQFGDQSGQSYQYTRPKTQEEKVADMFKTRQHLDVARGVHSAVS